jgi:hypothetical protein
MSARSTLEAAVVIAETKLASAKAELEQRSPSRFRSSEISREIIASFDELAAARRALLVFELIGGQLPRI